MSSLNPLDHPICLSIPERLGPTTWIEHVPFALYLVDVLRPRIFVELGSAHGVSYCAFCQAVKTTGSPTRCFAVDTWRGDPHAGVATDQALTEVRAHHDPLYSSFSELLQMTFDEAANRFEDGSVDLLHIDGYHTYDAVKHDFETWLPKMSSRGVILFHDIAVRLRDFGVWRFWVELKERYPSYEVEFGHGLGLLAVGPEQPLAIEKLTKASAEELKSVREFFRSAGALAARLNEEEMLKREARARKFFESERVSNIQRAHPILTRAGNFLNMWSTEGLARALSLTAAKLKGNAGPASANNNSRSAQEYR